MLVSGQEEDIRQLFVCDVVLAKQKFKDNS